MVVFQVLRAGFCFWRQKIRALWFWRRWHFLFLSRFMFVSRLRWLARKENQSYYCPYSSGESNSNSWESLLLRKLLVLARPEPKLYTPIGCCWVPHQCLFIVWARKKRVILTLYRYWEIHCFCWHSPCSVLFLLGPFFHTPGCLQGTALVFWKMNNPGPWEQSSALVQNGKKSWELC